MPVLTVGGKASFGGMLAPQIRPLVDNMRSVMIEDCGHYLAEERPDQLVEELTAFFSEAI
jgi:pimeloyl-ACP methyl ester carboxylesterase